MQPTERFYEADAYRTAAPLSSRPPGRWKGAAASSPWPGRSFIPKAAASPPTAAS